MSISYEEKLIINEIEGTSTNKIIIDNAHRVIPIMLRQELIQINKRVVSLTSKGKKRFKRTTKADREKWRRELSDIVCSWIGKAES